MKQDTLTGAADKQPLVSVIMPAYNAEKYIGEAVASVCAQTYENWELLILDDGSADRTVEIAESYAQQDARIQVLRNPQNMGVARTRNRGFDLAQGEWIALLDSDDRWRAQKLEKQLALAVRSGSQLLYTSYALFADAEREMRVYRVPQSVDYRRLLGEMSSAALPYCFTGRCWSGFAFARTCFMRTMRCGWRSCAAETLLPVVPRCWLTGAFQNSQDRLTNAPRP